MKRSWTSVVTTGALLALGGLAASCGITYTDITPSCPNFERGHVDANGQPDECHLNDPLCPGECVKRVAFPWIGPALVWIGPADETPEDCPNDTYSPSIFGFADPVIQGVCPECTCGPPSGSCEPPATITARAAACATPGGWTTSFDPPASWDGSCTSDNAISAGKNCGGAPCVQSLTIGPLGVVEGDCPAFSGPPPLPLGSVYWKTQAKACVGPIREDLCGNDALVCVPSSEPPPPGYKQCVYKVGDSSCPEGYPEEHVIYEGFTDHRTCTPCKCGSPMGSICTANLSVFDDAGCGSTVLPGVQIASTQPACVDIVPVGPALGSKSLSNMTHHPGTCEASGGELTGVVELDSPATVCCIAKE